MGYNGIKVALPTETVTKASYLETYCQQILSIQTRYSREGFLVPLAIMVSEDTDEKTRTLLEENDFFGLRREQVTLMKQGMVAALFTNSGKIALTSGSKYQIEVHIIVLYNNKNNNNNNNDKQAKPHGHGDVHSLMYSTGTGEK